MRPVPALLLAALAACAAPGDPTTQPIPSSQYEPRLVEGWTIMVNRTLLGAEAELGARALRLLDTKLYDIGRVVPPGPCAELRKIPIWLGVNDGPNERAQYHPSKDWLTKHGFNPEKARAVEIGSARAFLKTSIEQPWMVLHELAHGYHDRILGFDHQGIQDAYREARKGSSYDSVLRISGIRERHYALSDPQEYFAEGCEAYFGTNDFFPFVKAELRLHDPKLFHLLEEIWH